MSESMESTERYRLSQNFAMLTSNEHPWNNTSRSAELSRKADPEPAAGPPLLPLFKIRT